jgi:hypothetical protein
MQYSYSADQGDLVVASGSTIVWRGRPAGMTVYKAFLLPGTEDAIVLLDYEQSKTARFRNLLRCRPDGQIVWTAEPPPGAVDSYVEVRWDERGLIAGSWSGYSLGIDVANGRITRTTFVK